MTSCGCTIATGVPELTFEEILGVLFGWLGLEVEVGTHGANGHSRSRPWTFRESFTEATSWETGPLLAARSYSPYATTTVRRSEASGSTRRHTKAAVGTTMTKKSAAAPFRS